MTPVDFDLWLKIANFALVIAVGLYTFFATRRKDVDLRIERLEQRLSDADARLSAATPREEFHSLALVISEMRGDVRASSAELRGIKDLMVRLENGVARHEEHLLKGQK